MYKGESVCELIHPQEVAKGIISESSLVGLGRFCSDLLAYVACNLSIERILLEKGDMIMSFAPVRGIEAFGGRVVLVLAGGPHKGVRERGGLHTLTTQFPLWSILSDRGWAACLDECEGLA